MTKKRINIASTILLVVFIVHGCIEKAKPKCDFPVEEEPAVFIGLDDDRSPSLQQIETALQRQHFTIGGYTLDLSPPINWTMDPLSDRSWRFWLHTLVWLEPLIHHHEKTGNPEALHHAVKITLDWISKNPQGKSRASEFAWYDMAVGLRAPYLSYLVRALEGNEQYKSTDRDKIRCSAVEHAEWLFDNENYKEGHNHGLYQDAGLFILAMQLSLHPLADAWKKRAQKRFIETLSATVSKTDGIHLEHSPGYHETITELVRLLSNATGINNDFVDELYLKMKKATAWFVMPDGKYVQFGDTDLQSAAPWVIEKNASSRGFQVFADTGIAFYRSEKSYLAFISWFHSRGHKHSDELSLAWAEKNRRILIDSGRYGYYYEEPGRIYAESSPAHNTVTFDDAPFTWRDGEPYGSGMLDGASSGEWYTVMAKNPLAKIQNNVIHRRVLVYKPDRTLIVIDEIEAFDCPSSLRYFHFAPNFEVISADTSDVHLRDSIGNVFVRALDKGASVDIVREKQDPVQGFTFPANRQWQPNYTLIFKSPKCDKPLITIFSAGEKIGNLVTDIKPSIISIEIGTEKIVLDWKVGHINISTHTEVKRRDQ